MNNFSEETFAGHNSEPEQENDKALQHCQTQLNDVKNKYLHILADFENLKKRQEKERLQWARVAQMDVLVPLLTFIDDFDRAAGQIKESISQDQSQWLQGFELIHKELQKYLEKVGVQDIKIKPNDEFNPELHESVMAVESPDISSGHIVQVLQKGYTFKGQILRPAKVSIAN